MSFNQGFTGRSIDSITGSDGEVLTRVAGQWVAAPNAGSGGTFTGVVLDPVNPNLIGHGTAGDPLKVDPNLNVTTVTASVITATDVITDYINFNYTSDPAWDNGRVWYNNTTHELNYWTEVNGFNVKIGQQLVQRCQNDSGIPLIKGTIVHITGSNNSTDTPRINIADWTNDNLSANTLGLVAENIGIGLTGYVITQGIIKGLNTDSYVPGQILYLSSSGQFTNIKPQAPKHIVSIGQVIRKQQNGGSVYVSIQNGYELEELHDVFITASLNGNLIAYDNGFWKNTNTLSGSYNIVGSVTGSNLHLTGALFVSGANNTTNSIFDVSSSNTAVRITQRGTGDAFRVEDEANPDIYPVIIKSDGKVGIGLTNPISSLQIAGSLTVGSSTRTYIGAAAHAEGSNTFASGNYSHAEGHLTTASGTYSHTEGRYTQALGEASHAEGNDTRALGLASHAEGWGTFAYDYSHAEGGFTYASGNYSHAEGDASTALGLGAHSEGTYTIARGAGCHAEGLRCLASGTYSHAEGNRTTASVDYSHAEGYLTIASGTYSHAEGRSTITVGLASHAEGINTITSGNYSHAEGGGTKAIGIHSHAEGYYTEAPGFSSHAEGSGTKASGSHAHAEGWYCEAHGHTSHAEGIRTIASGTAQHVAGLWNATSSDALYIIGNGSGNDVDNPTIINRSNIFEVYNDRVVTSGSLYVTNSLSGSQITGSFSGDGSGLTNVARPTGLGFSPFNIAAATAVSTTATTQYYYLTVADVTTTLSKMKIWGYGGSDTVLAGLYRGTFSSPTLIAQGSATCAAGPNVINLTAEPGQSLNVTAGEDLIVGIYIGGLSFRFLYGSGYSDLALAETDTENLLTMPAAPTGNATNIRFACTLY